MANLQLPANISKEDIHFFVDTITSKVMCGELDALTAHVRCKALIKGLEAILANIEQVALDEAYRAGKGNIVEGASVQLREGYGMPDFTQDDVCNDLTTQLKARQELLKQAFRMNGKAAIVDPDTGEVVPVMPVKANKTTLTVTFK